MAQEQTELRSVNWKEIFSFSHLFSSFRMGIHLSKLMLALAVIIVVFVAGWVLDGIWSAAGSYAHVSEPAMFLSQPDAAFEQGKQQWLEERDTASAGLRATRYNNRHTLAEFAGRLDGARVIPDEAEREPDDPWLGPAFAELWREKREEDFEPRQASTFQDDGWSENLARAREEFDKEVDKIEGLLEDSYEQARIDIGKSLKTSSAQEEAEENLAEEYTDALVALTDHQEQFNGQVEQVRGVPLYDKFMDYESTCLRNAVTAVLRGDIFTGLDVYQQMVRDEGQPMPAPGAAGFLFWVLAAVTGVHWLLAEHWLFAILLGAIVLAAWALFGGAIHRIAALHAARDEKISITQALKFSMSKFLSFFMAPLIPLAVIFILGGLLIVGGLLGNLWGFGAILVGLLFLLAILLGLAIAFLVVGLVTGAALMYPTIAVEGSDSFDAISRSFSYVFAKPWRAGLYAVVAVVYGVICYLFVRAFAYVALLATHWFAKIGIWAGGARLGAADKMDVMWPTPSFGDFHPPLPWEAMSTSESIGAFLIGMWVYLIAALVLAFALSYCASATTVIYYLLRRKVDATDLDDVYVEQTEEEFPPAEGEPPAEQQGDSQPQAPESSGDGGGASGESEDAGSDEQSQEPSDDEGAS